MRVRDEERGVAMVTALLVSFVIFILSIAVTTLSLHNSGASAADRKRAQAIASAEAGLDATFSILQGTSTASLPCTGDTRLHGTLATTPASEYTVTMTYYATYPPTGSAMSCPLSFNKRPAGAVLVSKGTAVIAGSAVAVSRTMQTEVRLAPQYGALAQAIFTNNSFQNQNNMTVNGFQGNDADVYVARGIWTCNNGSQLHGSVIVADLTSGQGTASMASSCTVYQDVWANSSATMSNSAVVGHDITSSLSTITMNNNTRVNNSARSGGACTGCSGKVGGSIAPNSMSPSPPQLAFPQVEYDQVAWQSSPFNYQIQTFSDCAAANTAISAGWTSQTVARITPQCALQWTNNTTINVRNNLAIITDGSITTINQANFVADGGPWTLYFIVPWSSATVGGVPSCSGGVHDISFSNKTSFSNLKVFTYSPCAITYSNNDDGLGGQIIGGTVNITNLYTLNYLPFQLATAATVDGYDIDIAYLREIVNQ
ncbi:MAG: pilus assembly PilX N-terminal domain-containing protein [Actinomycetota bacterium]|nr:pilus assembly PilX N-terminal domain-containing protein [Actinomycetota bacterium]